jgi:CheY-like chemotaxis protein
MINAFIQVVGIPDRSWELAVDADDAEVIFIYGDRKALLVQYRVDKLFCFISPKTAELNLPANVIHVNATSAITDAPKLLDALKKFQPTQKLVQLHKLPEKIEETKVKNLRILVIDDGQHNLVFAQALLGAHHNVTTTDRFETAMELLKTDSFDYVLTDLEMPGNLYYPALSPERIDLAGTYPYGLFIAFEATRRNLPVAIVTDGNHHENWISAALDVHKMEVVNGKPVRFFNDIGKRWDLALVELERLTNR